jgi:hypothetical protein
MSLPSVTTILSFVNQSAFANIPEHILLPAALRGTDVHNLVALHLQGLFYEVEPGLEGYHQSLVTWANEFVAKVIWVEQELVDNKRGFKGHPDAILLLRGDDGYTLIDWKTPVALSKSWRLQVGGYRLLAEANGYKIVRVASLRLDKIGGRAKFQEYTGTMVADSNVFLAALSVWNFYNKEK